MPFVTVWNLHISFIYLDCKSLNLHLCAFKIDFNNFHFCLALVLRPLVMLNVYITGLTHCPLGNFYAFSSYDFF